MSTHEKPEKPDLARGWEALEKKMDEDERAWLETASDEDIEKRMNEAGVTAASTPSAKALLARMQERESAPAENGGTPQAGDRASGAKVKVLPLQRRATPWVVGLALAAGAAVVAGKALGPDESAAGRHEQAEKLRDEAFAACAAKEWKACEGKLDQAKGLDGPGEGEPRVVKAREEIAAARSNGQK